jgi:tetratricopeptide (TPR) repeat protein
MYIDKFKAWGIVKRYRAADIIQIEAIIQGAELKGQPFDQVTFRGKAIDLDRIQRRQRREAKKSQVANMTRKQLLPILDGDELEPAVKLSKDDRSHTENEPPEATELDSVILGPIQIIGEKDVKSVDSFMSRTKTLTSPGRVLADSDQSIILENILLQLQIHLDKTHKTFFATTHPPRVDLDGTGHMDGSHTGLGARVAPRNPTTFCDIRTAFYYLRTNASHLAFPLLHKTCQRTAKAMPPGNQAFVIDLLATFSPATTFGFIEVRTLLLEFLSHLCARDFGKNHPITFICRNLLLSKALDADIVFRSLLYLLDEVRSRQDFHPEDWSRLQRAIISHQRRVQDLDAAESLCHQAISFCKEAFGPRSEQTCEALVELIHILTYQERYDEGLETCSEVLRLMEARLGAKYPDSRASFAMENMAELSFCKGNFEQAIMWLQLALRSAWNIRGGCDTTIHVRDKLEALFIAKGMFKEAQSLKASYPADIGVVDGHNGLLYWSDTTKREEPGCVVAPVHGR